MKIFCEECLVLPICIKSNWKDVFSKCTPIKDYMRDKVKDYANIKGMGLPTNTFNFHVRVGGLNKTFRLKVKNRMIFVSNQQDPYPSTYVIQRYSHDTL